jgi:uncharacterized protein YjbI with pentapeptide repeats
MLKNLHGEKKTGFTQADLTPILVDHGRYAVSKGGRRAVLTHADLSGLNLAGRNLAEADFSGASLVGASLGRTNLERASLYCADLRDSDLQQARLIRADMRGACFRGAKLAHAVLDGADLRAAMMMVMGGDDSVSLIDRGTLRGEGQKSQGPIGVDFSNASLKRASFGSARLDGANFEGAVLTGANFRGAKLSNVSFKGAVLVGVNLDDLGVPPESLEGCVLDITPEAKARAGELRSRLEGHMRWIVSNGAEGKPANVDGEDLRPLKGEITGRPLAGLSARNALAIGVDFSGCQLQAAHFDGADLRDANFTGADLRGAVLAGTRLAHANFADANLCGLPLNGGSSKQPDFNGAEATSGQFRAAKFDGDPGALGLPTAVQ